MVKGMMNYPETCATSKEAEAEQKRWRAEDDLRTLREAQKIKKDAVRYGAAIERAREMKKELSDVADEGDSD